MKDTDNHDPQQTAYEPRLVSQLDPDGYFFSAVHADPSPADPGAFLIPGGAIDRLPPDPLEPGLVYRPDEVGGWIGTEDHRRGALFVKRSGKRYTLGEAEDGAAYGGIGPVPNWLTQEVPPHAWSRWGEDGWTDDLAIKDALVLAEALALKNALLAEANQVIAPLQDALDLDMITTDEAEDLIQWKRYRVLLTRVDVSQGSVAWPDRPQ